MFGLETGYTLLLLLALLLVCVFEFINGFHDTANAVATVIYTRSLKPISAVVLSGILNGLGVFVGGTAVAIGIINLLPVETLVDQNIHHSLAMVGALLITAIFWNFITWYWGIPSSSSHALIGSILGVGIAFSLLPGTGEAAVNWSKAGDVGLSLLFSPLFGFGLAALLMFLLRILLPRKGEIFDAPKEGSSPPLWIRLILVLTCSAVSFSHGSNDGQKGVGLAMLILIGLVPASFALNEHAKLSDLDPIRIEISALASQMTGLNSAADSTKTKILGQLADLSTLSASTKAFSELPGNQKFRVRKDLLLLKNEIKQFTKGPFKDQISPDLRKQLETKSHSLAHFTDFAPGWVIIMIALSLGIGTMIGWKRIVVTIGEKIGKTHLTYAQGASAEIVAASTIAASTLAGLPVSTTHVLSSGIAGAMFAKGGLKNLQKSTLTKILLAWVLTLPVTIMLSGTLFFLFRALVD